MRFLLKITNPPEPFNSKVKNGTVGKIMQEAIADANPEAVYFTEMDGKRCAVLIVNIDDVSKIPVLAEPWFLNFNSHIEFHPVMSPEDLGRAGLDELGKKWG